ncbi:MAG TPA: hypothetical protein VM537_09075 [Anaerolineae bacterium]|nr:hypothetical protein [Anaerolineae bacterium]
MRKLIWILALLTLLPLVAGCSQVFEVRVLGSPTWSPPSVTAPAATPDVNATVVAAVQATNTALAQTPQAAPSATPTRPVIRQTRTPTPTFPPPTATPAATPPPPTVTPTPWPEPVRIQFPAGATSATVTGRLAGNGSVIYVLRALAGQTMQLAVAAPAGSLNMSIWGADGTVLKGYGAEAREWSGLLPSTQDYFIHLLSVQPATYSLTVSIPPLSPEASIELMAPNGGEQWLEGNTYMLSWISSGVAEVDIAVASGGKDLGIVASSVPAGLGQIPWAVPAGLVSNFGMAGSDSMRIRVSDSSDPALYDENDSPFTVSVTRIRFAPGETSATLTGRLERNAFDRYVLRAFAGQVMEVFMMSPQSDVPLTIIGADGLTLKTYMDGLAQWSGELPSTQDYFLEAVATGGDTSYQMTVRILPQETEPIRIQFAPGATTATVSGHVAQGSIDRYVLRALAEQTAEVLITAPGTDVVLDLMGADGAVLQHHTAGQRHWAGRLPSTQDYLVSVVSVGPASSYDLQIRIEPLTSTPTRIQFAAGTTWATMTGDLPRNGSRIYLLRALGGQTMTVGVMSPGNNVGLSIWGADGEFLKWHGDATPGWSGLLPATQDYYVEVITGEPSEYALTVEIPPL